MRRRLLHQGVSGFGRPVPGAQRETPLQMEIPFININVSYKTVTPTQFSELLLCLLLLKNNPNAKEVDFEVANSALLQGSDVKPCQY